MASRLLALTLDAHDPARVAGFWSGLLGRTPSYDARGLLLPGTATQVGLRFAPSDSVKRGPNLVHLHLTSSTPAAQQATVDRALGLGAHHLDVGQRPEDGHVVLGDPEGNELCVIEAGNVYLADCGPLGELACDGTRAVGLFWSAVLAWPLVWDRDEETAVQSPHGGTKVAWGGPPLAPRHGRSRQRLDLGVVDGDLASEVDRLVSLGAAVLEEAADGTVALADPDGTEFALTGS